MSKTLLYGATKVDEGNEAYSALASLEQFQWRNRVLVIFPDRRNARAARQENRLLADRDALQNRDMVILKIAGGSVRVLFGAGESLDATAIASELGDPAAGEFAAFLNARAARQENQLLADRDALQNRDMVILKIAGGSVRVLFGAGESLDATAIASELGDPAAGEFAAFLVGKDGTVKLKVSEPISRGELLAIVDSMPVRAAEIASDKQQTSDESEKRDD